LPVATQKSILIHGEDIASNEYVIKALEAKYRVWRSDDLPNLVNSANGHHPALILLELSKGRKKQLNTLKTLRSLLPEIIILVILDNKSTQEVAEILKHGAMDVFPEPYDPQLLVERVEALLKKR
jgi:DNA-binding response OmpR family regulator